MRRSLFALTAATFIFMHPAGASDGEEDLGRFQLVPDVAVPAKGGKARARTVLLDSSTGQTWVLLPGGSKGSEPGPLWVPIKVKSEDKEEKLVKSPLETKKRDNQQANETGRRHRNRLNRDFDDYDDDP